MGHDFNLDEEDLISNDNLLKVPLTFTSEDLEIPDLNDKFKPKPVKKMEVQKTEIVDIRKKKSKKKSNDII